MSAQLSMASSNPFRRRGPSTLSSPAHEGHSNPSSNNHAACTHANLPPASTSLRNTEASKKTTKKVRLQSPPPASPSTPSLPDSSSSAGKDTYSMFGRPPAPPIILGDASFHTAAKDASEDDGLNSVREAPVNPFSKTLETMENPRGDGPPQSQMEVMSPGRASMDVDAFKRLLMTGTSGQRTLPAVSSSQAHIAHALGDGGSGTDASSVSRQSMFEAVQEPHAESPRTSHEISEPEDDQRGLIAAHPQPSSGRKKAPPPTPNSKHGKLIKVELRGDTQRTALYSPPTPASITSQHYFSSSPLSQTDLNKPLPPAPRRTSHDSDRESVFDKEAAGKTPEPPSPSSSIRKKNAPAPPLGRRHSQLVSESKLGRSNSGRLSPKAEEEGVISISENRRPRSNSGRAPPPPPSRRPASIHRGASQTPLTSPSATSLSHLAPTPTIMSPSWSVLPPPPPSRGSSRSTSGGKAPSVISMESTSKNKRVSMPPPPPPPHRHGRSSMEAQSPGASQRPSGERSRRSIESGRRPSVASLVIQDAVEDNPTAHDILADLTKLQREIDALRNQSENQKIT